MLPNFLHVGAGKCKSTWLYRVCLAHPDTYVPGHGYDNVNFFVNSYHRGLDWYEETFFSEAEGQSAVGEFSNSYLAFEPAMERIARHLPDVKLTMTIMNPVHRIFYGWAHVHIKDKCAMELFGERRRVSRVELEEFLRNCGMDADRGMIVGLDHLLHHHGHSRFRRYASSSMYAFALKRLRRYFDPEQIKVMLYDDLLEDRGAFLRDFFGFLWVAEDFRPGIEPEDVNPDPPLLEHERWFPAELREELIEAFRPDIEELQRMLERDLSHWLDEAATDETEYCAKWR
jgi:hypothetical protein